jgi:hypothetical protein
MRLCDGVSPPHSLTYRLIAPSVSCNKNPLNQIHNDLQHQLLIPLCNTLLALPMSAGSRQVCLHRVTLWLIVEEPSLNEIGEVEILVENHLEIGLTNNA